jgi:ketosteroid isomerase-like protein
MCYLVPFAGVAREACVVHAARRGADASVETSQAGRDLRRETETSLGAPGRRRRLVATSALIRRFYSAFQQRDAAAMAACYHPEIVFSDPVFPRLEGWRAAAMWRMLCENGKDLRIEFSLLDAGEGDAPDAPHAPHAKEARAHWDAWYTFSQTGRSVLNRIDARFELRDGLIVRHVDSFDLHAWAAQALGLKGRLLGWLPPVQKAIRANAGRALEAYVRKNGLDPARG